MTKEADDLEAFTPSDKHEETGDSAAFSARAKSDAKLIDGIDFDIVDTSEEDAAQLAAKPEETKNDEPNPLLETARALGVGEEELKSIGGNAEALTAVVGLLQRMAAVATEPAPQGDAAETPGELDAILAMNPDDQVDPEMAKSLKVLAGMLKGMNTPKQAPANDGAADWHISQLGGDFADVFGKGSSSELPERSPQRVMRRLLVEEMDRIVSKARADKRAVPANDVAFNQALRVLHGDKVDAVKSRKLADSAKDRSKQLIGRPGAARAELPPGRARAVANVERLMKNAQ